MNKKVVGELFSLVRCRNPLVHHITNTVTINDCANVTLAIGASPVMATSVEEVEEMVQLANALVLNIGTIQAETFSAMILAGKAANEKGIPVIFDPVGVGATSYRKKIAGELLEKVRVTIIRGNASEIDSLVGGKGKTRGVDAEDKSFDVTQLATKAANLFSCVVVVSGKVDVVSNGKEIVQIENGDTWLTKVTGTGCMTTSLIGSFAGTTDDYFSASIAGMSAMSLAGERAKKNLSEGAGIGQFKVKLMDEIFHLDEYIWGKEVSIVES
ncbi:hydroxyethylthiazole kinase [Psychrobacillus soli]|uniref:Hydroxyethylthiazole kinase n=1 Tax=Psychrobacillus soli TaxID=1543965 RepID=A0A544T9U8_9BACI|nr:hydroxyethylthiazole kinase [Psychrobacillus soli]TQR14196.1 hydroxyethylthiazole kinase [Psychrobacillus soli]